MNEYSFFADLMDSFRSSSDLVKIIWLLCPILLVVSITGVIIAIRRLLSPTLLLSIDHPALGHIHVYQDKAALSLLAALRALPSKAISNSEHG